MYIQLKIKNSLTAIMWVLAHTFDGKLWHMTATYLTLKSFTQISKTLYVLTSQIEVGYVNQQATTFTILQKYFFFRHKNTSTITEYKATFSYSTSC